MLKPGHIFIGFITIVLFAIIGETIVKPLTTTVRSHNQLVSDCESKIPRDQFCELVAIPKVIK